MTYLLALDQGTTSSRAIVYDHGLRVVGSAQSAFAQYFPTPGWVEHDAEEIWTSQHTCIVEALRAAGIRGRDVAAVGISNQRETTVLWDRRSGRPIHRAIVWQDRRTEPLCAALRAAGHEPAIQRRTGLLLDPYFCASKIRWLLDHVPGARTAAERGDLCFGTIDSWLVWKLTGGAHLTEPSNAARTLLFDIHRGAWDDDLLALWEIPRALLPAVGPTSGALATVSTVEDLCCPIAGVAGDQQAALFGQACFTPGMAKCTYGTGCFILMHAGRTAPASTARLLTTVAWAIDGVTEYALEGSVFMGGALVQWLRDGLGIIREVGEVEALARSVEDAGGVIVVPAFTGLGAPHWDASARGLIIGLTRGTTRAHLARAALEGIAFQIADVLDAMAADAGRRIASLRVDGGAAANDLLMQIQADLLQTPLCRPAALERTARGAAALAGLAIGLWRDRAELAALPETSQSFAPSLPRSSVARQVARWRAAVERAGHWETEPPA